MSDPYEELRTKQAELDEEHRRRHEDPTPGEVALEEEMLKIQNDPTLTAGQRMARMRELAGEVGPMSGEDVMRRRDAT